jgi:hypothetical protein
MNDAEIVAREAATLFLAYCQCCYECRFLGAVPLRQALLGLGFEIFYRPIRRTEFAVDPENDREVGLFAKAQVDDSAGPTTNESERPGLLGNYPGPSQTDCGQEVAETAPARTTSL